MWAIRLLKSETCRGDLRLLPIPLGLEVEDMRELPKITTLEGFLAAMARMPAYMKQTEPSNTAE